VQILQIFNYSYTISFTIVLCQTNTQNALTVIHMKQSRLSTATSCLSLS